MRKKFNKILVYAFIILFYSCENFEHNIVKVEHEKIVPQETFLRVPSCLNNSAQKTFDGGEIYHYIRQYIALTEEVSIILETAYQRIHTIERSSSLEFSFTGFDGKTKNVSIQENFSEEGVVWDYYMELYNESFADLAVRAWWNKSPFEQKIYFRPSSLNTNAMASHPKAIAEIYYRTGSSASPFEKLQLISIVGLTTEQEISFDPDKIIIQIGQSGNILNVVGASNNPDAVLLNYNNRDGRNISFVAKVNVNENIAAVKLATPPSYIETSDDMFNNYPFKSVLVNELRELYPENASLTDDELIVAAGLDVNKVESPAYFNQTGFLSAGNIPSSVYSSLIDFEGMQPFVPVFVRDYSFQFDL